MYGKRQQGAALLMVMVVLAMLAAGMHSRTPAYTVAMAGISPNVGFVNIADQIALGRLKLGIAAGTENFSDIPIRLSQNIRRGLMKLRQRKQLGERLKVLASLRPGDLTLDIPQSSDYTTGLTMGEACERMVKGYGATREASAAGGLAPQPTWSRAVGRAGPSGPDERTQLPSRASSSSTTASSSLTKTGVGLAIGVPGTTGRRSHRGVAE